MKIAFPNEVVERFLSFVEPEPNTGCWLWSGAPRGDYYGSFNAKCFGLGTFPAHRFAYLAFRGVIPDYLFACHHCDVRSCVNPDHLFLGTASDNNQDFCNKVRAGLLIRRKRRKSVRQARVKLARLPEPELPPDLQPKPVKIRGPRPKKPKAITFHVEQPAATKKRTPRPKTTPRFDSSGASRLRTLLTDAGLLTSEGNPVYTRQPDDS